MKIFKNEREIYVKFLFCDYLVIKWLFEDFYKLFEVLDVNNLLKEDFVVSCKKRLMFGCGSRLGWFIWRLGERFV